MFTVAFCSNERVDDHQMKLQEHRQKLDQHKMYLMHIAAEADLVEQMEDSVGPLPSASVLDMKCR